jgi:hypothetical protein
MKPNPPDSSLFDVCMGEKAAFPTIPPDPLHCGDMLS